MAQARYLTYVLAGKGERRLWHRDVWPEVVKALDPLMNPDEDVGVRTTQIDRTTRREPRMGKLGWDAASHAKWPVDPADKARHFIGVQIWHPRWTVCDREQRIPGLFISIESPEILEPKPAGHFNQVAQVSIEESLQATKSQVLRAALARLNALMEGVAAFVRGSPWNAGGDCVVDALNNRFRYPVSSGRLLCNDVVPDAGLLAEEGWVPHEPSGPLAEAAALPATSGLFGPGGLFGGPELSDTEEAAPPPSSPSDPVVYDKAKYHSGGDFPDDLPSDQAFVHTGMYLGWIVERGLYSADFADGMEDLIASFHAREVTGRELYEHHDGCLIDDMLSAEGNAFTAAYFDFDRGQYLDDYEELLCGGLPSQYHVEDTWENYDLLRARIDERFAAWKASAQGSPATKKMKKATSPKRTPRTRSGERAKGAQRGRKKKR